MSFRNPMLGLAKFALAAANESFDAPPPPVHGAMGGLSFLRNNHFQRLANRKEVDNLLGRVMLLQDQFSREGKDREHQKRIELLTKLENVRKRLEEIRDENELLKYTTAEDEAALLKVLSGIVQEVGNSTNSNNGRIV